MGSMKDLFGDLPYGSPPPPPKPSLPPSPSPPPPEDPLSGIPREVVTLFEKLAHQIAAQGFKRYSARAILHRIRWHYHIERGMRDFKCNNNWTPRMSRWFLDRNPHLGEFFETRASPHAGEDEDY